MIVTFRSNYKHLKIETLLPAEHIKKSVVNLESPRAKMERLNEMDPSKWLTFTKTWFILNPLPRLNKIIHPATFPEELVSSFIEFFTKPGDWILDPFLGSGTTSICAKKLNRNSVGIELYKQYADFAREAVLNIKSDCRSIIIDGDSKEVLSIFQEIGIKKVDFCITSPPYWCQLGRIGERSSERFFKGLQVKYGEDQKDLGNIDSYEQFLSIQEQIFDSIYAIMRSRSYLVVVTNNVYRNGRLYPLAFDTFRDLSKKWVPKDEKIWCQDDKHLFPFGMFHSYIGNRSHHYCLIFRKE